MHQGWRDAPVCERCWVEREGKTTVIELDGMEVERLIELRLPVRLKAEHCEVETCSFCGYPTFVGIFQRRLVWIEPSDDDEGTIVPDEQLGLDLPPAVDKPTVVRE